MALIPPRSTDIDNFGTPIKFTIVNSQRISKRVFKNKDSISANPLSHGQVITRRYDSLERVIDDLKHLYKDNQFPNKVLITGVHASSEFELQTGNSEFARNQKTFSFHKGRGLLHIDFDPYLNDLTRNELYHSLYNAVPELKSLNSIHKPSAGSCVYDGETQIKGLSGQHIFFEVPDATDIPRIADILYKRLWLKGYGYIKIAKNGAMLERTLVDRAVFSPERIIYLGAVLEEGLTQEMDIRYRSGRGEYTKIQELTLEESKEYLNIVAREKEKSSTKSTEVQKEYYEEMSEITGIPTFDLMTDVENQVLPGNWPIYLDRFTRVTVDQILADPDKYNKSRCCDPLIPDTYDYEQCAQINLRGILSSIYSHAHGGERKFSLVEGLPSFSMYNDGSRFEKVEDDIDYIAKAFVYSNESEVTKEELRDALVTKYKISKTAINKELSKAVKVYRRQKQEMYKEEKQEISLNTSALHMDEEIPWESFPDRIEKENTEGILVISGLKSTVNNLAHLSEMYGITYRYDELLKYQYIRIPKTEDSPLQSDLENDASIMRVKSQCQLNGLNSGTADYATILMDHNTINPVKSWILSKDWDGQDRFLDLLNTIKLKSTTDIPLAKTKLGLWLLQSIAALDSGYNSPLYKRGISKRTYEHILVLSGAQGISKTKWISSLVPMELTEYVKTGVMLALQDKDSRKLAISCWICELGELDSTFRKSDIAQLKAFISSPVDDMRLPFGKAENRFTRRTSYIASVNLSQFLQDLTGNRRFWTLEVESLDFMHSIDMQQLWRQIWDMYVGGEQWWPKSSMNQSLVEDAIKHESQSPIIEILDMYFDLDVDPRRGECVRANATGLIRACGEQATAYSKSQAIAYLKRKRGDPDKKMYFRVKPRIEFETQIRGLLGQPR